VIKNYRFTSSFATLILIALSSSGSQAEDLRPRDAVDVVLEAFTDHEIVALSEMHAMQQEHDFIQKLLMDKSLPEKADAVVMEGGNHLYQDILDKYILHDAIPLSDVRIVWRNSSQSPSVIWDAAVFEQIYVTIHDINKQLPSEKRVRVIAGGIPIDWSKVETRDDYAGYQMSRDAYFTQVVEDEVFAKDEKALLIIGGMHIIKAGGNSGGGGTVTRRLNAIRPGSVFVIWPHTGLLGADMDREYLPQEESEKLGIDTVTNASIEKRLATWSISSIGLVKDTWLGDLQLGLFLPGGFTFDGEYKSSSANVGGLTLSDAIDAYLYVGPVASMTLSPASKAAVSDESYHRELNRRSLIRFGTPFDPKSFITEPVKYFSEGP